MQMFPCILNGQRIILNTYEIMMKEIMHVIIWCSPINSIWIGTKPNIAECACGQGMLKA